MKYSTLLLLFLCFSCGKDKVILLPEIKTAKITEVTDVSPAYLFYDATQPDSLELNNKNLISTTNWLVNVDKRLTLKQAIPKIIVLQDKKRHAKMHKNENAKNYYTCNDTQIKNLGFIDFTEVVYREGYSTSLLAKTSQIYVDKTFIHPEIKINKKIQIIGFNADNSPEIITLNYSDFGDYLKSVREENPNDSVIVYLNFDKNLSFQDYITFKSLISNLKSDVITIDNNEFIY